MEIAGRNARTPSPDGRGALRYIFCIHYGRLQRGRHEASPQQAFRLWRPDDLLRIFSGRYFYVMLDKDDKPKVALHIENEMRWVMKKYKKLYPGKPLLHITPHVFRYIFCTNMTMRAWILKPCGMLWDIPM